MHDESNETSHGNRMRGKLIEVEAQKGIRHFSQEMSACECVSVGFRDSVRRSIGLGQMPLKTITKLFIILCNNSIEHASERAFGRADGHRSGGKPHGQ